MKDEYIERMVKCGMDPCEAYLTYHSFKTNYAFSDKQMEEFVRSLEKERKKCGDILTITLVVE